MATPNRVSPSADPSTPIGAHPLGWVVQCFAQSEFALDEDVAGGSWKLHIRVSVPGGLTMEYTEDEPYEYSWDRITGQVYRGCTVMQDPGKYPCPKCGKSFCDNANLKRHLGRKTPCQPILESSDAARGPGVRFSCKFCGRSFASKPSMYRHVRR